NYGSIIGGDDSIDVENLSAGGLIINRGTLTGGDDAFDADGDFEGRFENYSIMRGGSDGVDIDGIFSGEMFNCGIIEGGQFGFLVSAGATGTGTFHNHGGRVQGGFGAISMGNGNGTVLLSGPSHIIGSINGGAGTGDVLRFQDMRGVSAEKQAELLALATSDPNSGSITLFGESISWLNVEDIQADGSTLESYESLFSGTGLSGYGNSLDNLNGLDDSLREFLKILNDVSIDTLSEAASNSSGQTLRNAMSDLRRNRDTNFYHLFSNQFSSLRGDVAGGGSNLAVRSQGFLSQEVEIGSSVRVVEPEVSTWVTSYVGSSSQDGNGVRAAADYDESTILFGRGTEWGEGGWLGWFGGYSRTEGRVDGFGSYLENDGGWFGLNAQLRRGDAFATLVGGIGYQDIKTNRIDFLGNVHEGNADAFGAFFYSQVGRDFFFGEEGNGRWSPYAGFTYGGDAISAYSENGPAASALRFQDDTETVFQTVLGVSVTGYEETRKGWFRPRADLAWWHSYGDDSFGAGLANTNLLNNFSVVNPGANENRGVFQVGIEFGLDSLEDWTFEAGYFGVLGESDYNSNGATLGARVEF
ncbi:MAG: autotransporter outer membrane beta-barrel domain-containing protein, partial [Verrucomicrobiota bacterium]